jgi:hypothetical protein
VNQLCAIYGSTGCQFDDGFIRINMSSPDPKLTEYVLRQIRDFEESVQKRGDLLIIVLRFHLVAENLLERFIKAKLPRGKVLAENARLTFAQKLAVADAFGVLEENLVTAIRRLNALRNMCAHEKGKEVRLRDLDLIGEPLGMELSSAKPDPDETVVNEVGLAAALFSSIQQGILNHLAPLELEQM